MSYLIGFIAGFLLCAWLGREKPEPEVIPPSPRYLIGAHVYNERGTKIEHKYTPECSTDADTCECNAIMHNLFMRWPDRKIDFIWSR